MLAEVESVRSAPHPQWPALVELDVDDGTGALRVMFFNQPWRAKQLPVGTEALFFGKLDTYRGKRQFTNPVVDLVGNSTGRIVPIYPTTEKSGIAGWEFGEWVAEALQPGGRPSTTRCPSVARRARAHGPDHGVRRHPRSRHRAPSKTAARQRLAFDELLRLQLEVVMRRHVLERDARGIRHVVVPAAGQPDLVDAFRRPAAVRADRRPAARRGRDRARPGRALPMHRLLQGDVGSGKTVVALVRVARGGPRRPPGRAHGSHRGSGRAALPRCARAARRSRGARSPGVSAGRRPAGGGAAHQPHPGGGAGQAPRGSADGRCRPGGGHPRAAHRRRALRQPGRRGDRRAAPLRRRAARSAASQGSRRGGGRGRRSRPARHDGDAHPAHGRHGRVRRPRHHRARRAPGGADTGGDRWARTRRRRAGRPGSVCATRWRPGTAPTSCARSSRAPSGSRPSPPPRRRSPARVRRPRRACASGCSTAS